MDKEFAIPGANGKGAADSEIISSRVNSIVKLSLVPNCERKFIIHDIPKDIKVEMRKLPPLEVMIVMPDSYPSHHKPLLLLLTQFYTPFSGALYEKLNEQWSEENPVMYQIVCYL